MKATKIRSVPFLAPANSWPEFVLDPGLGGGNGTACVQGSCAGGIVHVNPATERLTKVRTSVEDVQPFLAAAMDGILFSVRNELWQIA